MQAEFGRRISIAAINSPSAVTVAGDEDVLAVLAPQLDELGIFTRYLTGRVPYHTHFMDAIKEDLLGGARRNVVEGCHHAAVFDGHG